MSRDPFLTPPPRIARLLRAVRLTVAPEGAFEGRLNALRTGKLDRAAAGPAAAHARASSPPAGGDPKNTVEIQLPRKDAACQNLPIACREPASGLPETYPRPARRLPEPARDLPRTCQNLPFPATRPWPTATSRATVSTVINGDPRAWTAPQTPLPGLDTVKERQGAACGYNHPARRYGSHKASTGPHLGDETDGVGITGWPSPPNEPCDDLPRSGS